MKEIGGYLDFETYAGNEYYDNLLQINTGRNAILLTIKEKEYRKIWIPRYICDCIPKMLSQMSIEYGYYDIDLNFKPMNFVPADDSKSAVLVVNYFGQFNNEDLLDIKEKYKRVIVDNTQSFFQRPCQDIDTIYTCRKYFGVPDGAYLHLTGKSRYYDSLPTDYSYQRMVHILGRYEKNATEFYFHFQKTEESFACEDVKKMSLLSKNLLRSINYDSVRTQRMENLQYLDSHLKQANRLLINQENCLYMYPFLHESGSLIKKELIRHKIYIPTLWPNVLEECSPDTVEYHLANDLVPIPIDQRYTIEDMSYIVKLLLQIIERI